LVKIDFLLP